MTQDKEKTKETGHVSNDEKSKCVTVTPQKPGLFSVDVGSTWKTPIIRASLKTQPFNQIRSVGGSTSSSCGSGSRQGTGVYLTPNRVIKTDSPLERIQSSESSSSSCHTPPNRIYNPFDTYSSESLHLPSFSPSVFATVCSPGAQEKPFRWSIDQMAILTPADIDENSLQEAVVRPVDSEQEKKAQEAIVKFFSQNSIAPSPWSDGNKPASPQVTERQEESKPAVKNVRCQTSISIPTNFDLDSILGMFNTVLEEDQTGNDLSAEEEMLRCSSLSTSLRRKLFSQQCKDMDSQEASMSDSVMSVEDTAVASTPPRCISSETMSLFSITPPHYIFAQTPQYTSSPSPNQAQFSSSPVSSERVPRTTMTPPTLLKSPEISPINMHKAQRISDTL